MRNVQLSLIANKSMCHGNCKDESVAFNATTLLGEMATFLHGEPNRGAVVCVQVYSIFCMSQVKTCFLQMLGL